MFHKLLEKQGKTPMFPLIGAVIVLTIGMLIYSDECKMFFDNIYLMIKK